MIPWRDPEPVPDEAHQGRVWGWDMYRDDGKGWGTYRLHFTSGGTGPCWNIEVDLLAEHYELRPALARRIIMRAVETLEEAE